MKKFLPVFFFIFTLFGAFFVSHPLPVNAQITNTAITPPPDGKWVLDPDVTFVGKVAARSNDFLNWTLQNYNWVCVKQDTAGRCDNTANPLETFWFQIFAIVAVFFGLFILITAFVLIITRGQNLTFRKFIPRIFFVIIFCVLSFSILRVIYVSADAIQGFFLKNPAYTAGSTDPVSMHPYISSANLLYVGFDYGTFQGLRRIGSEYDESAFITLLLTKLTAITYYAMTGILLIRKIILWFFIIISPIFPVLMLYNPVRNTAKIWVGEFFRWLLYAPLFAVLLAGLVALWRNPHADQAIPLGFNFSTETKITYPTAVNILLGGPGQQVFFKDQNNSNSVNNKQTFAQYAIALIMLWVVILLPFILLQIFLDYLSSISLNENWMSKQVMGNIFNKNKPGPEPIAPVSPGPIRSAGIARPIPFSTGAAMTRKETPAHQTRQVQADTELLRMTNLSVPSMRDIAQYEISRITNNINKTQEVVSTKDTLTKIANPNRISNTIEREHFSKMRDKLVKESTSGNPVATSILHAAGVQTNASTNNMSSVITQLANPEAATNTIEREKLVELKQTLVKESAKGNQLATAILQTTNITNVTNNTTITKESVDKIQEQILEAKKKGDPLAATLETVLVEKTKDQQASQAAFPVQNRVQSVSLEDYESVRKMWEENYKKIDVPSTLGTDRKGWVQQDVQKISHAVDLLSSADQTKVDEGMQMVSSILPFLLIGGFSQQEVIAYLKAKLAAAKSVAADLESHEQEEESLVETAHTTAEKQQHMTMEVQNEKEISPDEEKEQK